MHKAQHIVLFLLHKYGSTVWGVLLPDFTQLNSLVCFWIQSTNIWLALCYAGELGSTAFGASKRSGIAYTLNAIYPSPQAKLLPGQC